MRKLEVVTWDQATGTTVVDHVWTVATHHGKRKLAKLVRRANRWARKAAQYDKATDHVVYLREV